MSRYDAQVRRDMPDLFEPATGNRRCGHAVCQDYGSCQIGHAADEDSFLARSVLSDDDVAWCREQLAARWKT